MRVCDVCARNELAASTLHRFVPVMCAMLTSLPPTSSLVFLYAFTVLHDDDDDDAHMRHSNERVFVPCGIHC